MDGKNSAVASSHIDSSQSSSPRLSNGVPSRIPVFKSGTPAVLPHLGKKNLNAAFTLIELVVVITIIAIMSTLIAVRVGIFSFWKEEGFLRRLNETITFLQYQATVDRLYYEITFDFKENNYTVVALKPIKDTSNLVADPSIGHLTRELAELLSPALGVSHDASPPPDFPSLADPVPYPDGMKLIAVHMPNVDVDETTEKGTAHILFSPRGVVDGAVLQFENKQGSPINILVNPFTGLSTIYREPVDFDALLGQFGQDTQDDVQE